VLVAFTVRFFVPVSVEPSVRPALVVSFTTFTATEAPMPDAFPGLDCFAVAIAWLSRLEVALSERSPLTATGSVPRCRRRCSRRRR